MKIREIVQSDYYKEGEFYIYENKMYVLTFDSETLAHFIGPDSYNLFVPIENLWTFMPGIASIGNEITLL